MGHDTIEAEIAACEAKPLEATAAAALAYAQLLRLAEQRNSGQIPRVARFLAATYNDDVCRLDLFEPRAVDIAISDDMLCCLDALRWGRADLHTLVPNGDARMRALIQRWGLHTSIHEPGEKRAGRLWPARGNPGRQCKLDAAPARIARGVRVTA